MKIDSVILRTVRLKLKTPFETSFDRMNHRTCLIVEMTSGHHVGWGEAPHLDLPLYSSEYLESGNYLMKNILIPQVLGREISHPDEISEIFKPFKGNQFSKAGIEMAVWDLFAKQAGLPLNRFAGAVRDTCEIGVSVGLQNSIDDLLDVIGNYLRQGYRRIKIKIKPGKDLELVRAVRAKFPDIDFSVDANSAYTIEDTEIFKELDQFNLMMIEQPLSEDDIVDHATLQKQIQTPLCLDESIHNTDDARKAIQIGSCQIINIKPPRVGGITETKRIAALCKSEGIGAWIGGMLETAVGKALLDHTATFDGITLPGDNSPSSRYFVDDIAQDYSMKEGMIKIPDKPGIGLEINQEALDKYTLEKTIFTNDKFVKT